MENVCIVTAVDVEFKAAAGLLTDSSFTNETQMSVCRGRFGNRRVTVLKSEMGAIGFAGRLAGHLGQNRYDALVVAGLAGALDPKLKAGDAIVFDLCHDARSNPVEPNSREKRPAREENASIACDDKVSGFIFKTLQASGLPSFYGAGVTVDRIITRARDKISLGVRYGALAVDMETYQILSVCAMFGLSAAALRVVSDEAERDLPDFNRALSPDGRINNLRMASAMIANPVVSMRFLLSIKPVLNALRTGLKAVMGA